MAEPVVPGRLQGAPPGPVLTAFGARGASPQRLSGGAGRAWSAGGLVLKPVDDEAEATWAADVLSGLAEDGFRVNRPVRSDSGRWVVDGWAAWGALAGRHDASGRWLDVLIAGERFTAALQGLERPAFLDSRTHAWAAADRMAWGEAPVLVIHDRLRPLVERLLEHVGPHDSPSQVIHGDLAGNVLLAPGHPPGIIDFTPYWRPAPFCSAVVVVDALLWHGAEDSLLAAVPGPERLSLLARAALYRLFASDSLATGRPPDGAEAYVRAEARSHERVLGLLDRDRSSGVGARRR